MGAYSYAQDPNNSYLLTTSKQGWRALQALLEEGKEATTLRWREGATAAAKARSQCYPDMALASFRLDATKIS